MAFEKIGTIQRRLAWPLHKDDAQTLRTPMTFFFRELFLALTTGQQHRHNRKKRTTCSTRANTEDYNEFVSGVILSLPDQEQTHVHKSYQDMPNQESCFLFDGILSLAVPPETNRSLDL